MLNNYFPGRNQTQNREEYISYGVIETTPLLGASGAFDIPRHKDSRLWVRVPARVWHATGSRLFPQGPKNTFRPASHWSSRWVGTLWRLLQKWGLAGLLHPVLKSYLNVLLVFVPLGIVSTGIHWKPDVVFALNFLAIIPLSNILHTALEDLSVNLSDTFKRLLVAFSDNVIELIVSRKCPFPYLSD